MAVPLTPHLFTHSPSFCFLSMRIFRPLLLVLALGYFTIAASFAAPSADELASLTLAEAAAQVRAGKVTSVQLTEACLARI